MAAGTAYSVKVDGLREVQRAFRRMAGELAPELRAALRRAAEPVAADARRREQRWHGASISTIGPRITPAGVSVTQRARKVTGKRPDFGALQMREAMLPALADHVDEVERAAEDVLDVILNIGG